MAVYSARTAAFAFGGLIWLSYASMDPAVVEEFCDGYTSIKFRVIERLEAKGVETLAEHEIHKLADLHSQVIECEQYCLTIGWICFIPLVLFQAHSLMTLKLYREQVENNNEKVTAADPFEHEE